MARERSYERELQLEEQPGHARVAKVQRLAWAMLALLVLALLLGLFGGHGALSTTSARTPDGALEVRYPRLTRQSAPATLEIRVAPAAIGSRPLVLRLDREYLRAARIERVSPEPIRVAGAGRDLRFEFAVEPGTAARVVFHTKMQESGVLRGRIALAPDRSLDLLQFVYP